MLHLMTLHYLQHVYYTRKGFYTRFFFNIKAILDHKKRRKELSPLVIQYLEACSRQSDAVNMVSEKSNQGLHASVICFLFYVSTHFLNVHLVKLKCHSQLLVKLILTLLSVPVKTIASNKQFHNSIRLSVEVNDFWPKLTQAEAIVTQAQTLEIMVLWW